MQQQICRDATFHYNVYEIHNFLQITIKYLCNSCPYMCDSGLEKTYTSKNESKFQRKNLVLK